MNAVSHGGSVGRLLSPGEVGPSSLKVANAAALAAPIAPWAASIIQGLKSGLAFATKHPELVGSLLGTARGALVRSPDRTEEELRHDPHAETRDRIFGAMGGAAGGALGGHLFRRGSAGLFASTALKGVQAGRAIGDAAMSPAFVPASVNSLLSGSRPSEKHVFEKYIDEFGHRIHAGEEVPEHEQQKYVSALRDMYREAKKNNVSSAHPDSKAGFLLGSAAALALVPANSLKNEAMATAVSKGMFMAGLSKSERGFQGSNVLLASIPGVVERLAGKSREFHSTYKKPTMEVESTSVAARRSQLSESGLRSLLRRSALEQGPNKDTK